MQEITLLSINGSFFNNSGVDIFYNNQNFKSFTFEVVNHLQKSTLQPDTFEVNAIFDDTFPNAQTVQDVFANAKVEVFQLIENQINVVLSGVVEKIDIKTSSFSFKVQSELYKLNRSLSKKYSETCRVAFCSTDCQLSIANHTHEVSILDKCSYSVILQEIPPVKYWANGLLKINKNDKIIVLPIRGINGNEVLLFDAVPTEISNGDTVEIVASCNKTLKTCSEIYKNAINFQGEPFVFTS